MNYCEAKDYLFEGFIRPKDIAGLQRILEGDYSDLTEEDINLLPSFKQHIPEIIHELINES